MAKGPAVWIGIDGIDGTFKTTACQYIREEIDIPFITFGEGNWPIEIRKNSDAFAMNVVGQVAEYLPSMLIDRTLVSTWVYEHLDFNSLPWETLYPKRKTIFITLVDDVERTIIREGLQAYSDLKIKRLNEQQRFLQASERLGRKGYPTQIISCIGGPEIIAAKIIEILRARQFEILDIEKKKAWEDEFVG